MVGRQSDRNKERSGIFGSLAPLPIHSRSLVADEGKDAGEAKAIFLVSDRTGWTAEQAVDAALGQFEQCLVDRLCPMNTHLFSGPFQRETSNPVGDPTKEPLFTDHMAWLSMAGIFPNCCSMQHTCQDVAICYDSEFSIDLIDLLIV